MCITTSNNFLHGWTPSTTSWTAAAVTSRQSSPVLTASSTSSSPRWLLSSPPVPWPFWGYTTTMPPAHGSLPSGIFWMTLAIKYGLPMLGWLITLMPWSGLPLTKEEMVNVQKRIADKKDALRHEVIAEQGGNNCREYAVTPCKDRKGFIRSFGFCRFYPSFINIKGFYHEQDHPVESERWHFTKENPASPPPLWARPLPCPTHTERGGRSGRRQRLLPRHLLVYAGSGKARHPGRRQGCLQLDGAAMTRFLVYLNGEKNGRAQGRLLHLSGWT